MDKLAIQHFSSVFQSSELVAQEHRKLYHEVQETDLSIFFQSCVHKTVICICPIVRMGECLQTFQNIFFLVSRIGKKKFHILFGL